MATPIPYQNTIVAPQGGVNSFAGQGMEYEFTLTLPRASDGQVLPGEITLLLTDNLSALQTQIGYGDATGKNLTFCQTFNNKVYGLAGNDVFTSEINAPTSWNNPNGEGNGFVALLNWWSSPEQLVSMSPYQGRLAFMSRRTTQIWQIDPDLTNWQIVQTLQNIGALAKLSVQSLGELDVLMLSDTGIRSLRVRDSSLNAIVTDIGSAVDSLVLTDLLALTDAQKATSCGIVEPSQNRYWCFIPNAAGTSGKIYVLSYFPANKIIGWSYYVPTDNSGTAFVPQKFVTYNGQVYARGTDALYQYGGTDNNTYDASVATLQIPFYDEKRPGHKKFAKKVDADLTGTWTFKGSPDWVNNSSTTIGTPTTSTFDQGWVGYEDTGTHFSFTLQTTGSTAAMVNSIIFYYDIAEEP